MAEKQTPNRGLAWGYNQGENGWGSGFNRNMKMMDALLCPAVISRTLTAPPGSPADGDRYIVGASATGDWEGEDGNFAQWFDDPGEWKFYEAGRGMTAWVAAGDAFYYHNGSAWKALTANTALNNWLNNALEGITGEGGGGGGDGVLAVNLNAADVVLDTEDLDGIGLIEVTLSSDPSVTRYIDVPAGLRQLVFTGTPENGLYAWSVRQGATVVTFSGAGGGIVVIGDDVDDMYLVFRIYRSLNQLHDGPRTYAGKAGKVMMAINPAIVHSDTWTQRWDFAPAADVRDALDVYSTAEVDSIVGGAGLTDAPSDGSFYARKDGDWETIDGGGGGLTDAPSDGSFYARKDGDWETVPGAATTEYRTALFVHIAPLEDDDQSVAARIPMTNNVTIEANLAGFEVEVLANYTSSATYNVVRRVRSTGVETVIGTIGIASGASPAITLATVSGLAYELDQTTHALDIQIDGTPDATGCVSIAARMESAIGSPVYRTVWFVHNVPLTTTDQSAAARIPLTEDVRIAANLVGFEVEVLADFTSSATYNIVRRVRSTGTETTVGTIGIASGASPAITLATTGAAAFDFDQTTHTFDIQIDGAPDTTGCVSIGARFEVR